MIDEENNISINWFHLLDKTRVKIASYSESLQ